MKKNILSILLLTALAFVATACGSNSDDGPTPAPEPTYLTPGTDVRPTGWVAPVNYADHQVYSFDAVVVKDWKTRSYDLFYSYFSFLDINWNNWKTTLAKRSVEFIPSIMPSFNDRRSSSSSYYYTFGDGGSDADYINFCNVAKRNIGAHNIVFINSWNDWNNGTNLEPSEEKAAQPAGGTADYEHFLKVTRSQFKK